MAAVAGNLVQLASQDGSGEDSVCEAWAFNVAPLELTPELDPIVGRVTGIGPALFAYMRLRCGADTIKPDLRVQRALRATGLRVPTSHAAIVLSHALAADLGIRTCELDKLLWMR